MHWMELVKSYTSISTGEIPKQNTCYAKLAAIIASGQPTHGVWQEETGFRNWVLKCLTPDGEPTVVADKNTWTY
jgi:hypothetical protein